MSTLTRKVIITGAGFSVPWGGQTANQLTTQLLNMCDPYRQQVKTQLLLESDYEVVLNQLESKNNGYPIDLANYFKRLIEEFFEMQNNWFESYSYANRVAERQFLQYLQSLIESERERGIVFATLNQDVFLELMWGKKCDPHGIRGKLSDVCYDVNVLPFGPRVVQSADRHIDCKETIKIDTSETGLLDICLSPGLNYLKLHGSSNWQSGDSKLMITGGNKMSDVSGHKSLSAILNLFIEELTRNKCDILIIGCSMRDEHICEPVRESLRKNDSRLIVWDLNAKEVAKQILFNAGLNPANVLLIPMTVTDALAFDGSSHSISCRSILQEYFRCNIQLT